MFRFLILLLLTSTSLAAQISNRTAEEREMLADSARLYAQKGDRLSKLRAADAWFRADSFANVRALMLPQAKADSLAGTTDSIAAATLHVIGQSLRSEFRQAEIIPWAKREVAMIAKLAGDVNQRARAYGLLGETESKLGFGKAALEHLRIALDGFRSAQEPDWERWLQAHWYYIDAAALEQDVQLVNNSITAAGDLLERVPNPSSFQSWYTYFTGAKAAERTGDFDRALSLIDKAEVYARRAGNPVWRGTLYNTRGLTLLSRDGTGTPAVVRNLEKSIELLEPVPGQEHNINYTRFNLGFIEYQDGKLDVALRRIAKPIAFFREKNLPAAGNGLQLIAAIQEEQGDFRGAVESYSDLVRYHSGEQVTEKDGIVFARPDSVDQLLDIMEAYKFRAYNFWDLGERENALLDFMAFFDLQDLQRARYSSDPSRRVLSESGRIVYDGAIDLCKELADSTGKETYLWQALQISERAKAYSLMRTLKNDLLSQSPEERRLRYRIADLERRAPTDSVATSALASAVLKLENLLAARPRLTPEEEYLSRQSLTELVASLDVDLLEYHLTEENNYLFHLNPDGQLSLFVLEGGEDLEGLTETWRTAIRESAYRTKSLRPQAEQQALDATFVANGALLKAVLFPQRLELGERVCIVPDGVLFNLPFAALPNESPAVVNYREMDYFHTGRKVFAVYSVNLLHQIEAEGSRNYDADFIAFAPSFRGEATVNEVSRLRGARITAKKKDDSALPGLRPLVHNDKEVLAIEDLLSDTRTYLGSEASKYNFLDQLGKSRVLHISSHGLMDAEDPNLSYLAFSQTGDSLTIAELLFYNDLSALPVNAELVVLSACETNLGKLGAGEAPLSMASAFTAAGARSTLTTLWQVDDEVTKELMIQFYQALRTGKDKAAALEAAQDSIIAGGHYAHPYFWAGMVLQGSNAPLPLEAPSNNWFWYGVLLFAGVFFLGVIAVRLLRA